MQQTALLPTDIKQLNHELRTPLTGILGMTYFLNQSSLTAKQRKLVNEIQKAGEQLLDAINNLSCLKCQNEKNSSRKPKKIKVLMIEDEPLIQRIHSKMLEEMGYEVVLAETGQKAIDLYDDSFDAILTDIGLPDIDGLVVSKTIRARNAKKRVPIIALTAYGDLNKNEYVQAGIDELLIKPIKRDTLSEILKKYIVKKQSKIA